MDRAELSGEIVRQLAEMFAAEVGRAAPTLMRADLDGIERQMQVLGRRVFGQVVEHIVAARAAAELTIAAPDCADCGRPKLSGSAGPTGK